MATQKAVGGWQESINVAGIATGGAGKFDGPKGIYKVKTLKAESVKHKDESKPNNVKFSFEVLEPKTHAGKRLFKTVSNPSNEKTRWVWKGALLSHGVPAQGLEKGNVNIGHSTFEGKTAYIDFTPAVEEGGYYDTQFVTPDRFAGAQKAGGHTASKTKKEGEFDLADKTSDEVDDDADSLL
jgi:hypothetical protein